MSGKGPYRKYNTDVSIKIPRNSAWRWRNQMEEYVLDRAEEVQKEFDIIQSGRLIYIYAVIHKLYKHTATLYIAPIIIHAGLACVTIKVQQCRKCRMLTMETH